MRVEARYAGRQRYYSGIINWFALFLKLYSSSPFSKHTRRNEFCFVLAARVRRPGELFDVLYDDGDQEFYVKVRPYRRHSALYIYLGECVEECSITCTIETINS